MSTMSRKRPVFDNFAELMEQLGDIPPERILMQPPPGTATEKHVLAAEEAHRKRLCELIDGVLVEKALGLQESFLGMELAHLIRTYLDTNPLGIVLGADGMIRTFPGQVRIPDISFISWDRFPRGEVPAEAISSAVPNLAVEVLSPSNTKKEMARKLRDYFLAGVELAWLIDPKKQTGEIYTAPDVCRRISKSQSLDGGTVLPGFRLPLKQLFACTVQHRPRS
jgi:Uma2 family endonuclease